MSTFPGFDRPLNQYKVSELKAFLRTRSLRVGGLKKVLIKRLREALKKECESANDANGSDEESVIEEDPPQSESKQNDKEDEQTDTNRIKETNHDNTKGIKDTNDEKIETETNAIHTQTKGDNDIDDKNDKNDKKDEHDNTQKDTEADHNKEIKHTETVQNNTKEANDKASTQNITQKQSETEHKAEVKPTPMDKNAKTESNIVKSKQEDNKSLVSGAKELDTKGRAKGEGKCTPTETAASTDSCVVPSVSNTNNNKETTNHDIVHNKAPQNNRNQQKIATKQLKKAPEPIMDYPEQDTEDKDHKETLSIASSSTSDANTEKEQEARDQQLAAMRALLLRQKLLKQQKSSSTSTHSSIDIVSNSKNTKNTKKRSVRDFEEDTHDQSHKRRKLNEKNLEITESKHGRIVVETSGDHENRKLYIPPHQRHGEEGLNDETHQIEFDDKDTIAGSALFIDGFRRPLQTKKVEHELIKYGLVKNFKMNAIKSHCYVVFDTNESASKCKECMDSMHFPPNIPQIHAGKLKVKRVRMMEAMKFIQSEEQRGRRLKRSFDTKQSQRFEITVETKKESKTPKELFKMTSCTPYIFWREADEETQKKNEEILNGLVTQEKERYRVWKEKKEKKESKKREESKEREREREKEEEKEKDLERERDEREVHRERRDREHRDDRVQRGRRDSHRGSGHMRGRNNNGYFRDRMRQTRGNMRYYGGRRGNGRRNYRGHPRDDRRDRRERDRRDRDRRYRDRRNRRKYREESESESDDESRSESGRSRSRSRSKSKSKSSVSSSESDRSSKRDGDKKDNIPTTTTTTISTLESSVKEASTEFVHPERMNRIES